VAFGVFYLAAVLTLWSMMSYISAAWKYLTAE
jgi:CDP-diacylglycerol--glycerol-3-phosphate 3-phosphatidyltransferase